MTVFETAARTLPEAIANLDLGYLGRKLLDDDAFEAQRRNGERLWDEDRVERALNEYKQFLALMHWHPEASLVPSEDIDEVWHTHVLNTARYQADCEMIFGRFQHHAPTSGGSEELQEEQMKDHDETLRLFDEAFGEVPQSYTFNASDRCRREAYDRCRREAYDRCRREAYDRCRRM